MKLKLIIFFIYCLSALTSWSQSTISGTVTDESSQPLPGVNVIVKGTSIGTATNFDGNFSIKAEVGQTLILTYLGFRDQVIVINSQDKLNIIMVEDASSLDEVVVIGYGTSKKSDLTGSVVSVSAEDLTDRPVPSVTQALQGKAPGVLVRTNSAAPGGGVSVVIRGQNSVNSGSGPLYVVDGIPLSDISTIPAEDIQSVEVLKDASATAIYGSRGANGVVLVTTKKGKKGSAPTITYSNRVTLESIPTDLNLMNAQEFITFYTDFELASNPSLDPNNVWYNGSAFDRPNVDTTQNTDWFDVISQPGIIQNHTLGVSGGGEKNQYSLSASYLTQEGVFIAGEYDRFVVKASNTSDLTDWLQAGLNLFVSRDETSNSGATEGNFVGQSISMSPALPIYKEDGTYQFNTFPGTQALDNPYSTAVERTDFNRQNRMFGNLFLNIKPLKDLNLKISFGGDIRDVKRYFYNPTTTFTGNLLGGSAILGNTTNEYMINEYILSYKKEFGKHSFDVVGGYTYEQNVLESFEASATGFFTDSFKFNNLEAGTVFGTPESERTKWSLASGLGRIQYNFDNRYLLTGSARYDGSSRFGQDNKWGFFPSIAGAWRVSQESFLQDSNAITNLKLRASWGEVGNQDIGLYQSLSTFELANYPFGNSIVSGVAAENLANTDLKWETTATTNFAIELGLWNKVNFTAEYYKKKTRDLLLQVSLIETTGFSNALLNTGKMENEGMEFSLDIPIISTKDFKWNSNTAVWFNRNKITELTGDATQDWRIGNPIGSRQGFLYDGIIRTQEDLDAYSDVDGNPINGSQLGDARIVDVSGPDGIPDGLITGDDFVLVFNPEADFAFSLNHSLSYKNFSLDLFFYGTVGNQINNLTQNRLMNTLNIRNNMSRDLLSIDDNGNVTKNYWTPDNTDADLPRLTSNRYAPNFEDGSFLRLQNISLAYNLPNFGVFKSAQIYASMQNVFTITSYSGWDPDVNTANGNNNIGQDNTSYPIPRSLTMGLNVTF